MAAAIVDQLRERVETLVEGGSRYQTEKIAVVGVYLVIVIATLVWVFGGDDPENPLGAKYGFETIAPLNDRIFFIENGGPRPWNDVRIALNRNYLHKIPRVDVDQRLILRPEDFDYYFYVPRQFGRQPWEGLSKTEKPGPKAPSDVETKIVEVRANEGRVNIDVASENAVKAASAQPASAAGAQAGPGAP